MKTEIEIFNEFFGCKFQKEGVVLVAKLRTGVLGIGTDEPPFHGMPSIPSIFGIP